MKINEKPCLPAGRELIRKIRKNFMVKMVEWLKFHLLAHHKPIVCFQKDKINTRFIKFIFIGVFTLHLLFTIGKDCDFLSDYIGYFKGNIGGFWQEIGYCYGVCCRVGKNNYSPPLVLAALQRQ